MNHPSPYTRQRESPSVRRKTSPRAMLAPTPPESRDAPPFLALFDGMQVSLDAEDTCPTTLPWLGCINEAPLSMLCGDGRTAEVPRLRPSGLVLRAR